VGRGVKKLKEGNIETGKQLKRPHQKKRMVLEMGVNYVCQER